jgi:uncharacterized protein YbjT (DUF2867 family)
VVEALTGAGHPVRIVSRDAARATRRFGPGCDVAEADAESGHGLDAAIEGCQGVFLSIASAQEGPCAARVLEVARRSGGVERVVYVSGCTVRKENGWFPLVASKLQAERHLREGPISWTVLAPGWFFETLTNFVRGGRATLLGDNPTPCHFVAARDFARIAAQAFERTEARDRRFVVHGPEGITIRDALVRYCRVRHPEIRKVSRPPLWVLGLMARTRAHPQLKDALALMAYFERVGEGGDPSETNALFGAPTTTLEAWLGTQC